MDRSRFRPPLVLDSSSTDGTKLAAVVYGNPGNIYTSSDSGATWTLRASDLNKYWQGIAMSADGSKLIASAYRGAVYVSNDYGVTWITNNSIQNFYGVASSSDGSHLVATSPGYMYTFGSPAATPQPTPSASPTTAGSITYTWTKLDLTTCSCDSIASSSDGSKLIAGNDFAATRGHLYISSNYGAKWIERGPIQSWSAVASSSDGTKLVATVKEGQVYTSSDSGVTWTHRDHARRWDSVASSSDGAKLVAAVEGGQIYTSLDYGATWTAQDSVRNWTSVASSSDGTKLVAVARANQIFTSTNSGATWTPRESARLWRSVASSGDGTKLAAAVYASGDSSFIYTSADSGITWTVRANDAARYWQAIAMSQDGSKLVASSYMGTVYTSQDYGATWISGNSIQNGTAVAASSDGTTFVVSGTLGGYIYTTAKIVREAAKIPPSKVKGSIIIKKLSAKSYLLTVTSNSPLSKFTITAKKKKNRTLTFKGTTDGKGGASVKVAVNLLGYSLTLKF